MFSVNILRADAGGAACSYVATRIACADRPRCVISSGLERRFGGSVVFADV